MIVKPACAPRDELTVGPNSVRKLAKALTGATVIVEHRLIEGQVDNAANGLERLPWVLNQILVAHLKVSPTGSGLVSRRR